ncbi:MAG: hypothetical protein ACMXX8_02510, partial [Candidatus Woesearchaeota archaeon]
MKKIYLNLVSLIFIFLIVLFPVSAMHAKVYGSNEIPNFSRGLNDPLTFEMLINPSPNHEISLSEIMITFPSFGTEISFNSDFCQEAFCEDVDDPNLPPKRCKCITNWAFDEPFSFQLKYDENNNGNVDTLYYANFFPDYKPPFFEQISLTQKDNGIEINYNVKDEACNNCDTCSGIKNVLVSDSSGVIKEFNIDSSNCVIQRTDFFNYSTEGNINFNFIVRDRLWSSPEDNNHQSIESRTYSVDFSPPIISSNFKVYKNNKEVNYISSSGLTGTTISFIVEDKNLDKISAKLGDIGNNNNIALTSYNNHCNEISSNTYNCSFNNIHILNNEVELEITAVDTKQNTASSTLSSNLVLDNNKPNVMSIKTDAHYNDQSYVKNGINVFEVIINEQNSGISKENVKLNLGNLNLGQNLEADECIKEGNDWRCIWEREFNVNNGQTYTIYLSGCKDNALNLCEGISQSNLLADNALPEIENIEIYAIGDLGPRTYFQSNDIINVKAYINRKGSPLKSAVADFSDLFSGTNDLVQGNCNPLDDQRYLCEWETERIKAGYYIARLNFKFTDVALNVNEIEKSIAVYGISTNVPDNFNIEVNQRDIIPGAINRLVASLLNNPPGYKITVPFQITGGGNDINILNYYVDNCKINGDANPYNNLFKDIRNPTPDRVPLLKLPNATKNSLEFTMGHFQGPDLNMLNDFDVTCEINIFQTQTTHDGVFVFNYPEVKNVSFRLNVVGSALDGKPGEKVIDKIQKKREGVLVDQKWITQTANAITKLENICLYANKLMGLWSVFASIESLGAGLARANDNYEWVYKIGCTLYEGYGSIIARIYYGSTLKQGFTVNRCTDKLEEFKHEGTGLGLAGRAPDSPELVSEAFSEWRSVDNVGKKGGLTFPGIRNICGFISCEYGTNLSRQISNLTGGAIIENLFSDDDREKTEESENAKLFFESFFRVPRNAPSFNPRNSIIMSAATLCVPGIFYNLNKYRQIECDYILCLKEVASEGGPISICDDQKKQNYCLVLFGEAYETIGILRFISSVGSVLSSSVVNLLPQGLKALYDVAVCEKKGTPDGKDMKVLIALTCTIPRAIHNLIDSYNRV